MNRKIVSALLTFMMLFSIAFPVFAAENDNTLVISLSDENIDFGKDTTMAELDLVIEKNPGVYAVNFALEYDETVMTYAGATDKHPSFIVISNPESNQMLLQGMRVKDYTDTGIITTLTFHLNKNCKPGAYKIALKQIDDRKVVSCYEKAENVGWALEGGTVTVANKTANRLDGISSDREEDTVTAVTQNVLILTIDNPVATVNGKQVVSDAAPLIVDGRTYTPARFVAEQLGAKVTWNAEKQLVTVIEGSTVIELTINSNVAKVNGRPVTMDAAAFIKDGRTYTPARFVAEQLGAKVVWDKTVRQVTITETIEVK